VVHFAAITFCITSQQVFLLSILTVMHDFQMVNLNEQYIGVKFCLKLRKTYRRQHLFTIMTQQAISSPVSAKTTVTHV
jgi:hypothetical protein